MNSQTTPELIDCQTIDQGVKLTFRLSEQIHYFNGHFPGTPILAGVVQLNWAVEYAKRYLDIAQTDVSAVEVLKFQQVLTPNTEVVLTLTQKDRHKFVFDYSSSVGNHASGRIKLEEPA